MSLDMTQIFGRINVVHTCMKKRVGTPEEALIMVMHQASAEEIDLKIKACENYLKIVKRDLELIRKGKMRKFCALPKYSVN